MVALLRLVNTTAVAAFASLVSWFFLVPFISALFVRPIIVRTMGFYHKKIPFVGCMRESIEMGYDNRIYIRPPIRDMAPFVN